MASEQARQTTWRYRIVCLAGHGWTVAQGGYTAEQEDEARAKVRTMAMRHAAEYGAHTFVGYWEREREQKR